MKITKLFKSRVSSIFFGYGLHLWLVVFFLNVGLYYVAHYYSLGKTCFTPAQVQSDNRCLYIWSGKVYDNGATRANPHQGHPCGTDVTSVIPPSHVANPARYLLPNYIGDICTAPPTPTPKPQPTATPVPTKAPLPTATPKPTATPVPTKAPLPTATLVPTAVPTARPSATSVPLPTPIKVVLVPTNTLMPSPTRSFAAATLPPTATSRPFPTTQKTFTLPTPTASISRITTVPLPTSQPKPTLRIVATTKPIVSYLPTAAPSALPIVSLLPSPTPTPAPLVGPGISYAFAKPGIGTLAANYRPVHATIPVTVYLYPPAANVSDTNATPEYTVSAQASYDTDPSSSTYGMYALQRADLGSSVPAGDYQVAFRTDQSLQTLITDANTTNSGTVFHLSPGVANTTVPQVKNMIVGDLNDDNTIDIKDYNLFVACYGSKSTDSDCTVAAKADLNDDGFIDGIDYILMLEGVQKLIGSGKVTLPPSAQPTAIPVFPSSKPIANITLPIRLVISPTPRKIISKATPTAVPTPTPSPAPKPDLMKAIVKGTNAVSLTKILSYIALFILFGVAVLGAFKSRLFNAVFHRGPIEHKVNPITQTQQTTAPVVQSAPSGKPEVTKVYYVTLSADPPVDGRYTLTLTDEQGTKVGYTMQKPPNDGYYSVTGYEEESEGATTVIVRTFTPAEKPV